MKPTETCTDNSAAIVAREPGQPNTSIRGLQAVGAGNGEGLLTIQFPGTLDLRSTLECGQAFRWREATGPDAQTWYKGVIGPVGAMIRAGLSSRLLVLYDNEAAHHRNLAGDIFNYFSLDDDLEAIYDFLGKAGFAAECKEDSVMKEAAKHARGLRILRQDPWECLVSYIISANKNIPAISKTVRHLSSALGSPAGLGEYTFPSPETLLDAGVERIKQSKCGYRAPYIIDAAAKVASNEVDLDGLWDLPTGEARQQLLKIRGVGPKVADCVLLFGYHRLEVFPVDVWIARCMSHFYLGGADITPREARQEGSRRFGPFAGYAQQVLFNYSRNVLRGNFKPGA